MKVLIACEESGIVRDAFIKQGHDAVSCDILPTRSPGPHLQCDVLTVLDHGWDLMIGFPPCTYLALCQIWREQKEGQEWRRPEKEKALVFARQLWNAPIPLIALENPKSVLSTRMAPKTQTIHPWQFGHGETKTTWLWLKGLPPLVPTNIVEGREQRVWKMSPGVNRSRERSVTYAGIAEAMAKQWGSL